MSKLKGTVAIVTGVSKDMGASIAKHLAAQGAAVAINYASSKEGADRVVAEITRNGGVPQGRQEDVARPAADGIDSARVGLSSRPVLDGRPGGGSL